MFPDVAPLFYMGQTRKTIFANHLGFKFNFSFDWFAYVFVGVKQMAGCAVVSFSGFERTFSFENEHCVFVHEACLHHGIITYFTSVN